VSPVCIVSSNQSSAPAAGTTRHRRNVTTCCTAAIPLAPCWLCVSNYGSSDAYVPCPCFTVVEQTSAPMQPSACPMLFSNSPRPLGLVKTLGCHAGMLCNFASQAQCSLVPSCAQVTLAADAGGACSALLMPNQLPATPPVEAPFLSNPLRLTAGGEAVTRVTLPSFPIVGQAVTLR